MNDAKEHPASDLLSGIAEIADYLGWTPRQAKHRAMTGDLPTFRIGRGRTVYARRSTLRAYLDTLDVQAAREAATLDDKPC